MATVGLSRYVPDRITNDPYEKKPPTGGFFSLEYKVIIPLYGHTDDVISGIDMRDLTGDPGSQVRTHKGGNISNLFDRYVSS